jgi:hypothetical protein
MNPTQPDTIIAEIHALREQFAKRYHNDLKAYSAAAEAHCRALGFPIAEGTRRRVIAAESKENTHAVSH